MARCPREESSSGIYHIMLRGINRQDIFTDDADRKRFLETVWHYKPISQFALYGYCLMDNHIHLLLKEEVEPISLVIKRISSSFVYWYNRRHERSGHLFQGRFKSEVVENEGYFLTVLRYIHQNPLPADLAKNILEYRWSSAADYLETSTAVDIEYALEMFSTDRAQAVGRLMRYMQEDNEDKCLDDDDKKPGLTDHQLRSYFAGLGLTDISELRELEKGHRDQIIRDLKALEGVTLRQLSRLTGISKSAIDRA
ncbi:MAG: transposase [Peptococcaceae bacterium]|nr:transposase [Candidatus Syntrophopropionicum ammoniitolerans]